MLTNLSCSSSKGLSSFLPAGLGQSSSVREGCLRLPTLLWPHLSEKVCGPVIESKGALLVPSNYDPPTIKTLTDAWLSFSGWQDFFLSVSYGTGIRSMACLPLRDQLYSHTPRQPGVGVLGWWWWCADRSCPSSGIDPKLSFYRCRVCIRSPPGGSAKHPSPEAL